MFKLIVENLNEYFKEAVADRYNSLQEKSPIISFKLAKCCLCVCKEEMKKY